MPVAAPIVAISVSSPRTQRPSRVSISFQASRAPARRSGHEGEQVALEPGVLDEPEVDEREDGRDRDRDLDDGQPGLDDVVGSGRLRVTGRSPTESISAVIDDASPAGRRPSAHVRASARSGGSDEMIRSACRIAPGTTTKVNATTTAKNTA